MSRGQRLGAALAAVIAFGVGMMTLFSLLLGNNPQLYGFAANAETVAGLVALPASIFVRLVTITIAITIIIGMFNLLYVHSRRLLNRGWHSLALLLSFALTIYWHVNRQGDASLLAAVQVPIESSLAALLCLSLVYGGATVLRKRANGWGFLFIAVMLLVLLGTLPLANLAPLRPWSDWLMTVPVSAGARGMLLGIALATLVAGVRVILGQDRSYRG